MKTETELRQIFKNNSNCYADTWKTDGGRMQEGEIILAIDEDKFIEIFNQQTKELQEQIAKLDLYNENYIEEISSLSKKLAARENELTTTVSVMQKHIDDQDELISEKDKEITELKNIIEGLYEDKAGADI
jgi:hypothetical protein